MASPTKILYVITKANWGGAQRYVFDLATHLPKDTFDVSVAFGRPGRLAAELRGAGIKTHEVRSMQRDISFGADARSFFELLRLFRKEKPQVVHLNSSKAGGVGALAARLAGVRTIIFTVHGWPFGERRNVLSRAAVWCLSWITALLSHTIITVSDYDLRKAQKMPFVHNKAVRIYNGIGPMHFGSGEKIRTAFPPGVTITGTIGELTKNKNQRTLIAEAAQDPNMFIAIVGEGEEREALEKEIAKHTLEARVKLFGFMPAHEALRGFDRFTLPSLKEGLPYVLLEAKQAGLPIIANRVGGVGEILDKDVSEFTLERMVEKTANLYRTL